MRPKKPLCIAPFIGMDWRGNRGPDESYEGFYKPCCDSKDCGDVSSKIKITAADSLDSIFNNPLAVEVRTKLMAGEFHAVCWRCKELSEQGLKAPPQKYDKILEGDLDSVSWDVKRGNLENKVLLLDYRPSNLCNLKCRMCSPANSSLIAMEEGQNSFLYNKWRRPSDLESIVPFSDLKLLKIAGGEPLIMPELKPALDKIKNNPKAMLVVLTNATKMDNTILEKIKALRIRRIHFQVSVDGTDKVYEYIRSGSRWKDLNDNISTLFHLNPHVEISIGVTLVAQMWNAFNYGEFIRWFVDLDKKFPNPNHYYPKIHLTRVIQDHLSLGVLNPIDREFIRNEILEAAPLLEPQDAHLIVEPLLNFLNESQKNPRTFAEETRRLDRLRKQDITTLNPKFSKYVS